MRKYSILLFLVIVACFGLFTVVKAKVKSDLAQPVQYPHVTAAPTQKLQQVKGIADVNVRKSLFVPYWSLGDNIQLDDSYDQYIYFGIAPTQDGVVLDDSEQNQLSNFVSNVPEGKEKLLTLRMLDADVTSSILDSKPNQSKVIADTVSLAQEQGFTGVVLDLELSAIPFDSLVKEINDFTGSFYQQTKQNNLTFTITLYGDTMYRPRPFDLKTLSKNADSFLVMAYDFHKAKGNPGPNFPLRGNDTYGYDMTQMTDDFLSVLPAKKVSVIFGLFGYDWAVDDKGNGTGTAKALTYDEIAQKFLGHCQFSHCTVQRDSTSTETTVHYTDQDRQQHIVWFEDPKSAQEKQKYLQGRGISSFSFWANGYF